MANINVSEMKAHELEDYLYDHQATAEQASKLYANEKAGLNRAEVLQTLGRYMGGWQAMNGQPPVAAPVAEEVEVVEKRKSKKGAK